MQSSHLNSGFAEPTVNASNVSALAPHGQPSFQHQTSTLPRNTELLQSNVPGPNILGVPSCSDRPRNHDGAQSYGAQGSDISQRSIQTQPPSFGSNFIPHIPQSAPYGSSASNFDQDLMLPYPGFPVNAGPSCSGAFHNAAGSSYSAGLPITAGPSYGDGFPNTAEPSHSGGHSQFAGVSSNVTRLVNMSPSNYDFEAPAYGLPTLDPRPFAYSSYASLSPLGIGFGQMDNSPNSSYYGCRPDVVGQKLQTLDLYQLAPNSVSSTEPFQGIVTDIDPSQVEMQADPVPTSTHDLSLMQCPPQHFLPGHIVPNSVEDSCNPLVDVSTSAHDLPAFLYSTNTHMPSAFPELALRGRHISEIGAESVHPNVMLLTQDTCSEHFLSWDDQRSVNHTLQGAVLGRKPTNAVGKAKASSNLRKSIPPNQERQVKEMRNDGACIVCQRYKKMVMFDEPRGHNTKVDLWLL